MTDASVDEQKAQPPTRRRYILAGVLAIIVLIPIGLAIWWFSYDPEEQAPILPTNTPSFGAETYTVNAEASVLTATFDGPAGTLESSYDMGGGTIEFIENAEGWQMEVNITFDARTLDVGDDAVNQLLMRILRVEEFPTGSFVASSTEPVTSLDGRQDVQINGQMELAGTVQAYDITAALTITEGTLKLTASAMIDAAEIFGEGIPGMSPEEGMDATFVIVADNE